MTPAGIRPATFRFVAQHLNHFATAGVQKERPVLFPEGLHNQLYIHQFDTPLPPSRRRSI